MLRVEDCKPGTEVICIDTSKFNQIGDSSNLRYIKLGGMYTIDYMCLCNDQPVIRLRETRGILYDCYPPVEVYYGLFRFRLPDPKALEVFRDMVENIDMSQFKEELEEV